MDSAPPDATPADVGGPDAGGHDAIPDATGSDAGVSPSVDAPMAMDVVSPVDKAPAPDASPQTDAPATTVDAPADTVADVAADRTTTADVATSDGGTGDATDARFFDSSVAADGAVGFLAWPGANAVTVVDDSNVFGMDLSGLFYEPAAGTTPAVLWGVDNGDSKLYRLTWTGSKFVPATTDGWTSGKKLQYPAGSGSPDCEAVTKAETNMSAVYVAAERNDDANSTSRLSVLRYDTTGTGTTIKATHEWNLTSEFPGLDANKGLEAIAWIPDSELLAKGFLDESTGAAYVPGTYADHGTGVFFVGLEGTGMIYGYTLNHSASTFHRVASISSGQPGVMDLSFDRDVGTLWSYCDETCNNRATLLDIDTTAGSASRGRYRVRSGFTHPSTLPNAGNEGIAIGAESECAAGRKPFFWSDDSNTDNHAIRRDSIPCGRLY